MLANVRFKGEIDGKNLYDYKYKIDWNEKDFNKRKLLLNDILNLNEYGMSNDLFWQDIWDCGICKVNIGVNDTRWEETDVAIFLESMGSYLLYGYEKKEKKGNKEIELNEGWTYNDVVTDKNYRLAPPIKIQQSDYKVRDLFNGSYEDYVNKVSKTRYEIKSRDSWERIKHNEEEKIKLLTEAKHNLNILKRQMEKMKKEGSLQYNKNEVIKVSNMNVQLRLSKQLERYGLSNENVLDIESKIYKLRDRGTNVALYHLTNNLKDMKDYMISCKLAYTNIVKINPPKCPTNYNILEKIDYLDSTHIKAMLLLEEVKLDPSKDLAIIAYDINKKIKDMYSMGELSDRDIYIIEGIRYNVPYGTLAKELGVTADAISKIINRICDNIVKSFYNDHMDLYFLNNSKGTYKKCSKCGEIKLISQFNKNGKKGLMPMCKKCESERKKK
jgi:hypothetical protein